MPAREVPAAAAEVVAEEAPDEAAEEEEVAEVAALEEEEDAWRFAIRTWLSLMLEAVARATSVARNMKLFIVELVCSSEGGR